MTKTERLAQLRAEVETALGALEGGADPVVINRDLRAVLDSDMQAMLDGWMEASELQARVRARDPLLKALRAAVAPAEGKPARSGPGPDRCRLTKSSVAALKPRTDDKIRIVWDTMLSGFAVRIMPSGTRTYFLQRRTKNGRDIKVTIGRADRVTAEQARAKAKELIAKVELGRDPAEELQAARAAERERRSDITVAQLWARWLNEHAERHKRASSIVGDRSIWRSHVTKLGSVRVRALTTEKIRTWHASIESKHSANRAVALLSALMSFAIEHGIRGEPSPTKGVRRHPEPRRERLLSTAELGRLLDALDQRSDRASRCISFLLAVGSRRGETLQMTWRDVDLESGIWRKPASTTKAKKEHTVPLSPAAVEILRSIGPGEPTTKVFRGVYAHTLRRAWTSICSEAQIEGARLHDLRHAFISLAIASGVPPAVAMQLAGHSDLSMTSRYTHGIDEAQRRAAAAIGDALTATRSSNVVPLRAGKPAAG